MSWKLEDPIRPVAAEPDSAALEKQLWNVLFPCFISLRYKA